MFVGAIEMGFAYDELRHMPLRRLQWFIYAYNEAHEQQQPGKEPKYREGTVAELKRLI